MKRTNQSLKKERLLLEVKELEQVIIRDIPRTPRDFAKKREPFYKRKKILNSLFKYSEKQITDFLRINKVLYNEMNTLYDEMLLVKQDVENMISTGKAYYKNYCIVGEIYISVPERNKLQNALRIELDESVWWRLFMYTNKENNKTADLLLDYNWNEESLEFLNKTNEYICYPLHCLAEHNYIMSFQDIIKIRDKDISSMISINFSNNKH